MAENSNDTTNNIGDVVGTTSTISSKLDSIARKLDDTNKHLSKLSGMSQTDAKEASESGSSYFRDRYREGRTTRSSRDGFNARGSGQSFSDALRGSFSRNLFGTQSNPFRGVIDNLAKQMGVSVKDVPSAFGQQLGQELAAKIKNSSIGGGITDTINRAVSGLSNKIAGMFGVDVKQTDAAAEAQEQVNAAQQAAQSASQTAVDEASQAAQDIANSVSNSSQTAIDSINKALEEVTNASQEAIHRVANEASRAQASNVLPAASGPTSEINSDDSKSLVSDILDSTKSSQASLTDAVDNVSGQFSSAAATMSSDMSQAGSMVSGLTSSFSRAIPAVIGLSAASKLLEPVIDGIGEYLNLMTTVGTRGVERFQILLGQKYERLKKDEEAYIRKPFEILQEAANALYDSWKQNIAVINQTQGYNKNDLMDLMSSFAQRFRDENLSSVIAGTDVVSALEKVLQSGLSGQIAEEFAYQAVKLNAAVPTQDFFDFAETYASVAANAVKDGHSQSEAIAKANESLYDFTNNVLYASRELTGGFTTGLKNATSIYEQAVKISQAARTNNASELASSLTAVSAVTGAIAPDLANSLVDAIYNAATGGNSSNLVALRSLAGVNASNTEFLRALATDSQKVLSTMFETLGNMYSQSPDAYMEKAEGYAELFGISAEAFQRVDFNYLAEQIREMNSNSGSLNENLALLQSGQSTSTAEQLKAQQINQYMIEEGLSYMIDNEFAQMVQQHMWDEQIAASLMDNEFGVKIIGESEGILKGIWNGVKSIIYGAGELLSGFSDTRRIEAAQNKLQNDIANSLVAARVGNGGQREVLAAATYGWTSDNIEQYTTPLVNLLTGKDSNQYSGYSHNWWYDLFWGDSGLTDNYFGQDVVENFGQLQALLETGLSSKINKDQISQYLRSSYGEKASSPWGSMPGVSDIYKRNLDLLEDYLYSDEAERGNNRRSNYNWSGLASKLSSSVSSSVLKAANTGTSSIQGLSELPERYAPKYSSDIQAKLDAFTDTNNIIENFVKKGLSYQDWIASASSIGIKDMSSFMESIGHDISEMEEIYENATIRAATETKIEKDQNAQKWYNAGQQFTETSWPDFDSRLGTQLYDFEENTKAQIIDFRDVNTSSIQGVQSYLSGIGIPSVVSSISALSSDISNYISSFEANHFDPHALNFAKYYLSWSTQWWGTYKTLVSTIQSKLDEHKINWEKHWKEYSDYYINNKIYSGGTLKLKTLESVQEAEKKGSGDVVNALAEYLTKNSWNLEDLQNPQVQTNALLSQILIVLNTIMNQTNKTSTGWTFSDTLSSLATGRPT